MLQLTFYWLMKICNVLECSGRVEVSLIIVLGKNGEWFRVRGGTGAETPGIRILNAFPLAPRKIVELFFIITTREGMTTSIADIKK